MFTYRAEKKKSNCFSNQRIVYLARFSLCSFVLKLIDSGDLSIFFFVYNRILLLHTEDVLVVGKRLFLTQINTLPCFLENFCL